MSSQKNAEERRRVRGEVELTKESARCAISIKDTKRDGQVFNEAGQEGNG